MSICSTVAVNAAFSTIFSSVVIFASDFFVSAAASPPILMPISGCFVVCQVYTLFVLSNTMQVHNWRQEDFVTRIFEAFPFKKVNELMHILVFVGLVDSEVPTQNRKKRCTSVRNSLPSILTEQD